MKRFIYIDCLFGLILISITYCILVTKYRDNYSNYVLTNNNHTDIYYTLTPIPNSKPFDDFGALVTGFDICDFTDNIIPSKISQLLLSDMRKYKFIILKNQCNLYDSIIPPKMLTNFAKQFGEPSQYRLPGFDVNGTEITAISNDAAFGRTTVSSLQWHIDGMWSILPKSICFQHIIKKPSFGNGGTKIINSIQMLKLMKNIQPDLYNELHELYVVYMSMQLNYQIIFPFIAKLPYNTNEEYMIINLLKHNMRHVIRVHDKKWIQELNIIGNGTYVKFQKIMVKKYSNDKRVTFYGKTQIENLRSKIEYFLDNECTINDTSNNNMYYRSFFEKGDLLMRDNLQLIHSSHPTSHMSPDVVGLRIIWRLCLNGHKYPLNTF